MKKAIVISSMIWALFISAVVYSQSSPQTVSRIRDATTGTTMANVSAMGATQPATNVGLNTAAGCYYAQGATWYQWSGALANSDAVAPATTRAPYVQGLGMYYDGTNWHRVTGETWDTTIATTNAPVGISLGAFYDLDNTTGYRWQGELLDVAMAGGTQPNVNAFGVFYSNLTYQRLEGQAIDDLMPLMPDAPYSIALNAFLNDDATSFQRWHGETWDTAIAGTAAPLTLSLNAFYDLDTTTGYRWTGEAWDGGMTSDTKHPNTNAYNVFYNGTNAQYWQGSVLSSETTANTTYAPHVKSFMSGYDATSGSWRWVNTVDAQADGQATTLNGLVTSSLLYGYNGSTFDMLRVGASNELQTTDVATRPGEDAANDWKKVKKQSIYTYAPAATTGTAVTGGAGLTVVLAAVEILDLTNVSLFLKNTDGGGAAFSDAEVSVSPDNSSWVALTWTDCDSLADTAICVYSISGNSYRYLRARVSSASDITVSAWLTGNNG